MIRGGLNIKKRLIVIIASVLLVLCIAVVFTVSNIPFADNSVNESSIGGAAFAATNDSAFSDIPSGAWYTAAVAYCSQNGLMTGTSQATFAPDSNLSRAMLVTILHRAAGTPAVTGSTAFEDVISGAWYSDAIIWASQNNIVSGYGNNRFGTDDPITREQLITILWRYDGSRKVASSPSFSDIASVSSWANEALSWGSEQNIANIKDGNRFDPKSNAIRAEAAYMLHQYLTGKESSAVSSVGKPIVYITTDISPEGLVEAYKALGATPTGKVAVKLSTGEPPNSNYLKPALIKDLVQLLDGTIVECNTAYGGSRASNAMHLQVAKDHGFTDIAEFDLMDADGSASLSVNNGEILTENFVGSHFGNYDYFVVLSHFKGHGMAGYGGAIKNISIGIASSEGKTWIHTGGTSKSGNIFGDQDSFLKSMAEAGKSVADSLNGNILYVNVMNRLSVDCDCSGNPAEPDMHDIGILASRDPVALDQACIDLVYAAADGQSLINRIESRNGILTLEHAEKIGLGSRTYELQNIVN